jgi:DNA-directed RNA polymerase specialized sigma24 family protein
MLSEQLLCRLLANLLAGVEDAPHEVEMLFGPRLEKVVRRILWEDRWLDWQDVLQEVWTTFLGQQGFWKLEGPGNLPGYLVRTAVRQALKARRYLCAQRRLQAPPGGKNASAAGPWDAEPRQQLEVSDLCEALVAGNDLARALVAQRLSGCELKEIADRLGVSLTKVKRSLRHMRKRLLALVR